MITTACCFKSGCYFR